MDVLASREANGIYIRLCAVGQAYKRAYKPKQSHLGSMSLGVQRAWGEGLMACSPRP